MKKFFEEKICLEDLKKSRSNCTFKTHLIDVKTEKDDLKKLKEDCIK